MTVLQLRIHENLYIKDPQSSTLGKKIVAEAIKQIDLLGFEAFTFRKLSLAIHSTEASIYRYFENKHRLLIYLITWYWSWLEYRIQLVTQNLPEPTDRLKAVLKEITNRHQQDDSFPDIDENALNRIVIAESDKTYRIKQVDQYNEDGLFRGYKSLCSYLARLISEINPSYKYPHALASTVLEASTQQLFFAEHLPSLSEVSQSKDPYVSNYNFLQELIFQTIDTSA
ncbi:TetR/AcrR family transcriptional regulator [Marinoscillum furvescens]|uniref:TetR family transcriptional regulator n=1 Tax=Marinoscillum furvescens DSM 4134 TaxID=1122208 RepID=A0A3D9L3B0_MARFU|nr:TetR/AcrR family transcriptional regulator [Marinoscillum furvescens]RED99533.1 TetR family transcriptional regulator [Marinoscillum furvescens DSM 4134]